jgi:hypothetical protein
MMFSKNFNIIALSEEFYEAIAVNSIRQFLIFRLKLPDPSKICKLYLVPRVTLQIAGVFAGMPSSLSASLAVPCV